MYFVMIFRDPTETPRHVYKWYESTMSDFCILQLQLAVMVWKTAMQLHHPWDARCDWSSEWKLLHRTTECFRWKATILAGSRIGHIHVEDSYLFEGLWLNHCHLPHWTIWEVRKDAWLWVCRSIRMSLDFQGYHEFSSGPMIHVNRMFHPWISHTL